MTVLATAQVEVTTLATLLISGSGTRTRLRIRPLQAGILFIGPDSGVTADNGYNPCGNIPTAQAEAELDGHTGDVYGIVTKGSMLVAVLGVD